MGQNLMRTDCAICEGEVMLEEEARSIRPTECVGHEHEYVGLLAVARARCRACGTLYLVWVRHDDPDFGSWLGGSDDESFVDLSFRHFFGVRPDMRRDRDRLRVENNQLFVERDQLLMDLTATQIELARYRHGRASGGNA